ncbi:LptA/OstA family protein [Silvanigrella aquatica]|uniref:Organic solvent tolerance-like N-terminal domain-containing protein n=1 Tax=Silvanigrella aquatica TaxID=1915309 RepID=A0A1L4CXX5_9BACT|nr:LptA/OstA family protein [Silvanigrella aquatica]APJ02790.1 hypothetical protein AXG55_02160 [Silvanigrella aquatica]
MFLFIKKSNNLKQSALYFILIILSRPIYADFENTIPENYSPSQSQSEKEDRSSNNTIRNGNETEKKPKQQQAQKHDNGLLNSDFAKHNANAPVYFEGKTAEGSRKTGILNLVGNVVIIQDDTKLTSDKAQIIGKPGNSFGSSSTSVEKAIATGNVHILKKNSNNSPEIKASANTIEFLVPKRIMILKGKAKVWKAQEFINAEYIEINLDSGDINLKEPHGTLDPRSSSKISKGNSFSDTPKDKVTK